LDLKIIREKNNLTQQQLADLIAVDRTLISKIECGVSTPSVYTAKKIAAALGFHWTKFYESDEEAATKDVV